MMLPLDPIVRMNGSAQSPRFLAHGTSAMAMPQVAKMRSSSSMNRMGLLEA